MPFTFEIRLKAMKRIARIVCVALFPLMLQSGAKAQIAYELVIDTIIGLPDTVVDGENVTFWLSVSTNSLFYQGDVYVELEYAGTIHAVDTSFANAAFLGPNSPTTVQATHRFSTDDNLSIGDNVVVVWPRIGDGITPPQSVPEPYTKTITVIEPMNVLEHGSTKQRYGLVYPNPSSLSFNIKLSASERLRSIRLTDMQGRVVLSSSGGHNHDVSSLPKGLYLVQATMTDGTELIDRLLLVD